MLTCLAFKDTAMVWLILMTPMAFSQKNFVMSLFLVCLFAKSTSANEPCKTSIIKSTQIKGKVLLVKLTSASQCYSVQFKCASLEWSSCEYFCNLFLLKNKGTYHDCKTCLMKHCEQLDEIKDFTSTTTEQIIATSKQKKKTCKDVTVYADFTTTPTEQTIVTSMQTNRPHKDVTVYAGNGDTASTNNRGVLIAVILILGVASVVLIISIILRKSCHRLRKRNQASDEHQGGPEFTETEPVYHEIDDYNVIGVRNLHLRPRLDVPFIKGTSLPVDERIATQSRGANGSKESEYHVPYSQLHSASSKSNLLLQCRQNEGAYSFTYSLSKGQTMPIVTKWEEKTESTKTKSYHSMQDNRDTNNTSVYHILQKDEDMPHLQVNLPENLLSSATLFTGTSSSCGKQNATKPGWENEFDDNYVVESQLRSNRSESNLLQCRQNEGTFSFASSIPKGQTWTNDTKGEEKNDRTERTSNTPVYYILQKDEEKMYFHGNKPEKLLHSVTQLRHSV